MILDHRRYANTKAAWSKVEESYPHITTIGCAAHALNLLLKDTMALKTMDTLYKRAKGMDRYVKGQVIAAIYLTKQSEKSMSTTLKLPSNTHWGGVVIMSSWMGRNGHISLPIWTAPSRGSSWMMYFGREW
jgi:hypothetical protein